MSKLSNRELEMLMNEDFDEINFDKREKKMRPVREDKKRSEKAKKEALAKRIPKNAEMIINKEKNKLKQKEKKHEQTVKQIAAKMAEKSGANMDTYKFKPKYDKAPRNRRANNQ